MLRVTMQRSALRMVRGFRTSKAAQSKGFRMSQLLFKSDHSVQGVRLSHKLNLALFGLGPLALVLSPSCPLSVLSPSSILSVPIDTLLALIIPLQVHIGGNDIISDYAHKVTRAEWFARYLRNGLFGATVITFCGLFKLNWQGPGIAEAVWSVWRQRSASREVSSGLAAEDYYGGAGGIGERIGLQEHDAVTVPGAHCVTRVATIAEAHESLREWATESNWREATRVHKNGRHGNTVQEEILQRIRAHYQEADPGKNAPTVRAALFRCNNAAEFSSLCERTAVSSKPPTLVKGTYDEKREKCIVDFANKRLGGGWLSTGMVQEEKIFIERPDLGALCARALLQMPTAVTAAAACKEASALLRKGEILLALGRMRMAMKSWIQYRGGVPLLASPFAMRESEAWVLSGAPAYASIGWYGRTPPNAHDKYQLLAPAEDAASCPTSALLALDPIRPSGGQCAFVCGQLTCDPCTLRLQLWLSTPSMRGSKCTSAGICR